MKPCNGDAVPGGLFDQVEEGLGVVNDFLSAVDKILGFTSLDFLLKGKEQRGL